MKKFLLLSALSALVSGCASYYSEPVVAENGMIYEPAGASTDPNPNWDVNARDINQRPYRSSIGVYTWGAGVPTYQTGAAGNAVYTSTDTEKNIGPQYRSGTELLP